MLVIISTVCQYIAKVRKKDGFWVNFNTVYNDINAFKKYTEEEFTDKSKQKEFLDFMKKNFPDIQLVPVFDLVNSGYLKCPYLGSYLVDADIGSDVYNTIIQKFENSDGTPKSNNLVIYVVPYETTRKYWEDRKKGLEEF